MPPVSATRSMTSRAHPRRAAATVFFSSIAIVSGPTPPGTGVSAPATSATVGMHVADDHRAAPLEVREPRRAGAEQLRATARDRSRG